MPNSITNFLCQISASCIKDATEFSCVYLYMSSIMQLTGAAQRRQLAAEAAERRRLLALEHAANAEEPPADGEPDGEPAEEPPALAEPDVAEETPADASAEEPPASPEQAHQALACNTLLKQ